ncbi:MAG: hypothetical protein ACXVC2_12670 [Bacteroidia bacterium]
MDNIIQFAIDHGFHEAKSLSKEQIKTLCRMLFSHLSTQASAEARSMEQLAKEGQVAIGITRNAHARKLRSFAGLLNVAYIENFK